MNVLVACEESQTVCAAFRKLGFNALAVTWLSALVDIQSGIFKMMHYK